MSLRIYGETTVDTFQSSLPRTLLEYSITLIDRFATLSRDHCLLSIGNHVKVTSLVSRDHPSFLFYSPLSLSPIRFSSPERCLRSIPRRDRLLSTFTSDVHRHHVTHHNRTDLTTKRNSLHDEWTHLEIASLQKGEKKEAHARYTNGRRDTPWRRLATHWSAASRRHAQTRTETQLSVRRHETGLLPTNRLHASHGGGS